MFNLVDNNILTECEKPYETGLKSFFNYHHIQDSDNFLRRDCQAKFSDLMKAHTFSGYKEIESKILKNRDFKAHDETNKKYMGYLKNNGLLYIFQYGYCMQQTATDKNSRRDSPRRYCNRGESEYEKRSLV